jgi:hypothetical protein
MEPAEYELEIHRIYVEARSHRNAFFEKLAIVDGGTVALVITAVLGPLHTALGNKHLLKVGLTLLVLGMLSLYLRNLLAAQFELLETKSTAMRDPNFTREPTARIGKWVAYAERAGLLFSTVGVLLLLVQIWMISI